MLVLALVPMATSALAQSEESPDTAAATNITRRDDSVLREREPKVYVLRDAEGHRIYVPDFSFERWEELVQRERNLLPARPPAFQFAEELGLEGQVVGNHVTFSVSCRFQLVSSDDAPADDEEEVASWHRIPLRFNRGIRSPEIEHDGLGEVVMIYRENGDGHVAWVRAAPGSSHRLQWTLKFPVIRSGGDSRVVLRAPALPLRLRLTIPEPYRDVTVNDPESHLLSVDVASEEETRITLESAGGDLEINWQQRDRIPAVVEATGDLKISIVGQQLEWTALLRVRSYGKPVDAFQVRLPATADLIPTADRDLVIRTVAADSPESARKIVEVRRRDGRPSVEFEATVRAIQSQTAAGAPASIETAGFEVVGAVRQSGTIQFEVDSEWNVDWLPGLYVRQVGGLTETLIRDNSAARFVYNHQPYSLQVLVATKQSRLTVEPTYVVDVGTTEMELEARFKYRNSGGRAQNLSISLADDWEIDRITPREYFTDYTYKNAQLKINLSPNAQTLTGDLELQVVASCTHQGEGEPLKATLPRPEVNAASPATVVILSAENVQLVPRTGELVGLIADAPNVPAEIPTRRQRPLVYQEEAGANAVVFAADLFVRGRTVQSSIESEVRFAANTMDVTQTLTYTIEYETLDRLSLAIPTEVVDRQQWQITLDGTVLPVTVLTPQEGESDEGESDDIESAVPAMAEVEVDLLEDRLGVCKLEVSFEVPVDLDPSAGSTRYVIPFIQPIENDFTEVVDNSLRVTSGEPWRVTMIDDRWTPIAIAEQPAVLSSEPAFRVDGALQNAVVELTFTQPERQSTTNVERVWIQSWLTSSIRRDRIAYRLLTNDAVVKLDLPIDIQDVEVAVNGRQWRRRKIENQQLTVELDPSTAVRNYTLELWYWTTAKSAPLGRITMPIPRVVDAEHVQRVYWQLIVPRTEHLLWASAALTPEYFWQWRQNHWGRRSNRGQAELEQMLGAAEQDSLPAATNQYLFSSVGPLMTVEVHTAARAVLVVAASGFTLLIGVVLIYFPQVRHPAAIVALGLVCLSLGAIYPEPVLLAGQAAVLGLTLVLLARLLHWTIALRRYHRPSIARMNPPARAGAPRSKPPVEKGSSRMTTTVAPPSFGVSAVENET
jgi:hypothetical protein